MAAWGGPCAGHTQALPLRIGRCTGGHEHPTPWQNHKYPAPRQCRCLYTRSLPRQQPLPCQQLADAVLVRLGPLPFAVATGHGQAAKAGPCGTPGLAFAETGLGSLAARPAHCTADLGC